MLGWLTLFLPFIRADHHKLDTAAWRVAFHLQSTKRINIMFGVPVGNAVDPSLFNWHTSKKFSGIVFYT
jgi:hypothetical protein